MKLPIQHTLATEKGTAAIPPGLPPSDLLRIQESFQSMAPQSEYFVRRFYEVLFRKFPYLRHLFPVESLSQHQGRFLDGLVHLILHLERPDVLRAALVQLGERHQAYGVTIHQYPPVVDTFLEVLVEVGGGRINGQTYAAWANFLHLIRAIMFEPYARKPLTDDQRPNSGAIHAHSLKRILLIDDDHQLLDLYQSYLENEGYFCSQTSDVPWAFAHLQLSAYNLVLTDFQMPVMNGIQLRKNLSQLRNEGWPPFVLVTGNPDQVIRKRALASGFVMVMKKPPILTELGAVVHRLLPHT